MFSRPRGNLQQDGLLCCQREYALDIIIETRLLARCETCRFSDRAESQAGARRGEGVGGC